MRRLILFIAAFLATAGMSEGRTLQDRKVDAALVDAVQKFCEGNYDAASLALVKLRNASPDNDAVYYYLGMSNYVQNKPALALEYLSKAYALDSLNQWYAIALANLYVASGEMLNAMPLLEKLVTVNPDTYASPYTLSLLGDMKYKSGRDSLAMQYYEQALFYDSSYVPAVLGLAEILRGRGDLDGFFATVEGIIVNPDVGADDKRDCLAYVLSGSSAGFYTENEGRIKGLVDKCIEMYPSYGGFRHIMVRLSYLDGDYSRAVRECEAIAADASSDAATRLSALSMMGDILYQQGERKKAFGAYEKALRIDSGYAPVLNNYAYFLSLEGKKLKKALVMSAGSIAAEPENATYLDTYGWILCAMRRYGEAEQYLKKAMVYGGRENAEVVRHYIYVLEMLGKTNNANYYRELLEKQ